jgi:hypothetical protein
MTPRALRWFAVVAVVAVIAAIFASRERRPEHATGVESGLYPQLAQTVNDVRAIRIHGAGDAVAVSLVREADGWGVAERGGYAADPARVRKLLQALVQAQILEQKTSLADNYAALGVEDTRLPQATGKRLELEGPEPAVSLIVGKQPDARTTYVRRDGEPQSWHVNVALDADTDPKAWLLADLIDVKRDRVQSVEVAVTGKPTWSIARTNDKEEFTVSGVPRGRKLTSPAAPAAIADALAALRIDDVRAVTSAAAPAAVTVVRTFDGLTVRASGHVDGDRRHLRLESSTTSDDPAQQKEAQDLQARSRGYEFEIAAYQYDALFRPLDTFFTK